MKIELAALIRVTTIFSLTMALMMTPFVTTHLSQHSHRVFQKKNCGSMGALAN
jgi:hypothetical protein